MSEREQKGYSVFGHPGTRFKVKKMSDGKWGWEVYAWKKVLVDGTEDTKEAAEKAMIRAAGKVLLKTAKQGADRSNLYNKLKGFCRKRPWLSIFVFDAIVNDMDLSTIMEAAAEEEEARHAAAVEKLGIEPLDLHPLAKPAKKVAEAIWETVEKLGWDRQRVDRFARDYLGTAYSNPEAARPIEVDAGKKKKREAEGEE
jgi:hypothetical protein